MVRRWLFTQTSFVGDPDATLGRVGDARLELSLYGEYAAGTGTSEAAVDAVLAEVSIEATA